MVPGADFLRLQNGDIHDTRKNPHYPNILSSFTNCLTDTIHRIVSVRKVRWYVMPTTLNLA